VTPPTRNGLSVARTFKRIHDMSPGKVGFEAVGEIDDDDSEDMVALVPL
jgi:hypothetical protein